MNLVPLRTLPPSHTRSGRGLHLLTRGILGLATPLAVGLPATAENEEAVADDVVTLAAYNVKADRIEDFGFRVSGPIIVFVAFVPRPEAPYITAVLPNTAAAKAGLRPGDRILKSDGRSAAMTAFNSSKWSKLMRAKNAEAAAGGKTVTWTLEIQPRSPTPEERAAGNVGPRSPPKPLSVTLTLPTPPPHWGAATWRAPEGRLPSVVAETGPLAERAREVLDHGILVGLDEPLSSVAPPAGPFSRTGYEWSFGGGREGLHRIVVTQAGGRTDVFLDMSSGATGRRIYLTSPSGVLEKAWRFTRKQKGEIALEEARTGFAHELDLWTTKVGKFSARWPFELMPGYDPNAIFAVLAAQEGTPAKAVAASGLPEAFLKLPPASEVQRALFAEAYATLGADQDSWAYTEMSRDFGDRRVRVMRVDPSKAEAERCVLLSIDGKPPTPADVQQWRDDGGDIPRVLGELPPLENLIDLQDLRVAGEDAGTVVFELPLRGEVGAFPGEKFSARFRVNAARRTFEDIAVALRDPLRVAGVAKVSEAGFQVRFQTIDPAFPPQPVYLKGGGAARVLLVKLARGFETTRTGFQRVEPHQERAPTAAGVIER